MLHPTLGKEHPSYKRFRHRHPFIPPKGDSRPINNLPIELLSRIFQSGTEDVLHGDVQDLMAIHASSRIEPCKLQLGNADDDGASYDETNTEKEVEEGTGEVHFTDDVQQIRQSPSDARLPHPFQTVVSHVCQHWRNAAISTASLWTCITISPVSQPPYQRVAASLERSKCLPIHIRVHFGSQEHRIKSIPSMADLELLYSLLVVHVHRWRSIEVRAASSQQMYAFLNAVSDPTVTAAPQLTSLVLSANQPTDDADVFWTLIVERSFTLFSGSAPRLQSVSLEGVSIDWSQDWISYASRLTTLELLEHSEDVSLSWHEFTTILRGAPALERLVLHRSRDPPSPNLDTDPNLEIVRSDANTPIQLLRLTHLSLLLQSPTCVCGLLRTLYMPALRSLTIDFFWDDYTEFLSYITAPATIPATLSTTARPRNLLRSLETLDIECLLCVTEVIEVLYDELENVRSLKISMDEFRYPSGCSLILPLLPPTVAGHGAVNVRLPRLEKLSISDVSRNLHLEEIREVVQQRNDAGFPVKSLYVQGISDSDFHEEDMVWFRENLEAFAFSRYI